MVIDANSVATIIAVSVLSGAGTALIASVNDNKKEKVRQKERYQDQLKMDLKDMKIKLYELEKELDEWKIKYYNTLEQLIGVKAELEETLTRISILSDLHLDPKTDLD
jgi:septal ring factor EnvC (AmiA/AmiB activator)